MSLGAHIGLRSTAALLWVGAVVSMCAPANAQSGPVIARAASVTGQVLLRSGAGAAISLTRGYVLTPGDIVDTRGGGSLVIDLSDGSMVVVQPESLLVLKDYRQANSLRELFQITVGQVRVKINHFAGKPNPYRMNSPTASIAVRGTAFTITVDRVGGTEVVVTEGLVEVSSLSAPDRRALIAAGRAVLVRPGQDLRLFLPGPGGGGVMRPDNDGPGRREGNTPGTGTPGSFPGGNSPGGIPPAGNPGTPMPRPGSPVGSEQRGMADGRLNPQESRPLPTAPSGQSGLPANFGAPPGGDGKFVGFHNDHDDLSPRAAAGTYERYLAGLSEIGQVPFLLRFNAFPEAHLDSLENPAFAGQFQTAEGRLFVLPTFSGLGSFTENTGAFGARGTSPASYSLSPQLSVFVPIPKSQWVVGGNITGSGIDSGVQSGGIGVDSFGPGPALPAASLNSTSGATSRYISGSLLAARRFGANGLGIEIERLNGTGKEWSERVDVDPDGTRTDRTDSSSDITQTRLTLGWQQALGKGHNLGIFYRHSFIDASDANVSHWIGTQSLPLETTRTQGHSAEIGLRLRGPLSKRFFYGVTASWLGLSLNEGMSRIFSADSIQRDRARRVTVGIGLGYMLGRRSVLTFDMAGGTSLASIVRGETATGALLQTGNGDSRFISTHVAVQSDLWKKLFVSASLLNVSQTHDRSFSLYPDSQGYVSPVSTSFLPFTASLAPAHSSDYGIGWRFTRNLFAQYVYTTDYGTSSASHTIMLRYTFHFRKD